MIKAKLELKGTGANMVRVVCYLEKQNDSDKSEKRYLVRTPVFPSKTIDETFEFEIPSYWLYGRIFLLLRSKFLIFTNTLFETSLIFNQFTPGERNAIQASCFKGDIFLTIEEEYFPRELPSGYNIRSPFFQIPLRSKPKKCFQMVSFFYASKSDASKNPQDIIVRAGSTKFLEPVDGLDVTLNNNPRTIIYNKMKDVQKDSFLIIVPGFFTNEGFECDVHYCVESPQFGDDDFVRPYIAEKEAVPFRFDAEEEGFAAITTNRCIYCCDEYKVLEIEPQIVYSPELKYYSNNIEFSKNIRHNIFKY